MPRFSTSLKTKSSKIPFLRSCFVLFLGSVVVSIQYVNYAITWLISIFRKPHLYWNLGDIKHFFSSHAWVTERQTFLELLEFFILNERSVYYQVSIRVNVVTEWRVQQVQQHYSFLDVLISGFIQYCCRSRRVFESSPFKGYD